jgi:hypothetical protein
LQCNLHPHNDSVTCIDFFLKHDKLYIIVGSSDCSVSLNDLDGNQLGVFGQEAHWKLDNGYLSIRNTPMKSASSVSIGPIKKETVDTIASIEREKEFIIEERKDQDTSLDCILPKLNKSLSIHPTFEFEDDAFVNNYNLRYNPWAKTILGN